MLDNSVRLLDLLEISVPILNAPMAGIAGGLLAAAVTDAGGLGFIGGGYGDSEWIDAQLDIATNARVGVGFVTWALDDRIEALARVLDRGVRHVWLSFGEPAPHIAEIHRAEGVAICQVQTTAEAIAAASAGADVIVAQGNEAGGHGRDNSSMHTLLAEVVQAVMPVPVVAAGGISTVDDLSAVLSIGAAGAAVGTRLYASYEALDTHAAKLRLVDNQGDATTRTTVFDVVRGPEWPTGYSGRALVNETVLRWEGHEEDLREQLDLQRDIYRRAVLEEDLDRRVIWAGSGITSIHQIDSAGEIVRGFQQRAATEGPEI